MPHRIPGAKLGKCAHSIRKFPRRERGAGGRSGWRDPGFHGNGMPRRRGDAIQSERRRDLLGERAEGKQRCGGSEAGVAILPERGSIHLAPGARPLGCSLSPSSSSSCCLCPPGAGGCHSGCNASIARIEIGGRGGGSAFALHASLRRLPPARWASLRRNPKGRPCALLARKGCSRLNGGAEANRWPFGGSPASLLFSPEGGSLG